MGVTEGGLIGLGIFAVVVLIVAVGYNIYNTKYLYDKVYTEKATIVKKKYKPSETYYTYDVVQKRNVMKTRPSKHYVYLKTESGLEYRQNWGDLYDVVIKGQEVIVKLQKQYTYKRNKPHTVIFQYHNLVSIEIGEDSYTVDGDEVPNYQNHILTYPEHLKEGA